MTSSAAGLRTGRGDLIAGLVLIALTLACFARLVRHPGGLIADAGRASIDHAQRDDFRPPGNDLTFLYLPHFRHVAQQFWKAGRLPQWDTRGFGGRPMVGNPQGGLFYPPVWLAWCTESPAALGWLTIGHLLWAAAGMYRLVREQDAGRPAATVSAGCFLMSPYVLAQVFEGHYPHVWAACWYPWAIGAYLQLRAGRCSSALVLAPVLALTFLAGHPQEWYYLTVALSAWVALDASLALARGSRRTAVVLLACWAMAVALALGLAAVELLPDLSAQQWTLRGSSSAAGKVSRYQLHLLNLFQLLDPRALGGPADYFGHDNYWETVLSLGLVPLVLAAVAAARHPDRARTRGWLLLVVAALVFAAGRKLGLFALLFQVMPGMDRFRVPARSLFLANLGASVLAGLGVETLARRSFAPGDWLRLGRFVRNGAIAVVAGLLLLAPLAGRGGPGTIDRPAQPMTRRAIRTLLRSEPGGPSRVGLAASNVARSATFWASLGGLALVLAAGRRRPGRQAACAVALGALGLVELAAHGHALIHVAPAGRFLGPDPISDALARQTPPAAGPFRIRARDPLYTDLRASSHGFEKINIYDSFQIQHAADLYETLYPLLYLMPPADTRAPMGEIVHQTRRALRQGVLDRWGVAFLVSDHVESEVAWPLVATGSLEGSAFAVHRNPTALPRAYVVPRAEPTPEDVAAVLCAVRTVDPREAVLMPSDPLGPVGRRQAFRPARWRSIDADREVVALTTEAPGLLVVAETWMPGWSATVDGRSAPVLRGNYAQRVIPLPTAGPHEVVLTYAAPGLVLGSAITLGSLILCGAGLAVTIASERRRDRRTGVPWRRPHVNTRSPGISLRVL